MSELNELVYIHSAEEFDQAQRKAFVQEMLARFQGKNLDLLSFEEVVKRLHLHTTLDRGLQDIAVAQIAGSCGRYTDFTRTFLPRRSGRNKERWRQIYTLARTGKGFPPIEVYKIDQVYFVKDGNHRVSVARELNWPTIQAYVTELPTVFTLTPDIQTDHLLIKEECAYFLEMTRLHELRPAADIVFTSPGRYEALLGYLALHQAVLAQSRPAPPSHDETVTDWYDHVYAPLIEHIKASGIMKRFPDRTPDDLLAWLVLHQKQVRLSHALPPTEYDETLQAFLQYIDQLTPLAVAKLEVEERLKGLVGY